MQTFIEVDHFQTPKASKRIEGDAFLCRKMPTENRLITVLSDGLGSGVKAGVLSTLTATMALTCISGNIPIERTARIINRTLPICSERKIRYATFTIVDISHDQEVKILEYDNPPYLLVRNGELVEIHKTTLRLPNRYRKEEGVQVSMFRAEPGDRLVFFSDGVVQSGMGTSAMPLGWGMAGVKAFVQQTILRDPTISARELARKVVQKSLWNDSLEAKDDVTCGVVYFRNPRKTLILTGPPFYSERDKELGELFRTYPGKKILCGGTTANIIARELGKKVTVQLNWLF
ncbi:MAG: SpoIIE family protein phosphatase, partial [Spirochaetales bacterium]